MKFPIIGTLVLAAAVSAAAQTFYAITDLGPGRAYAISETGHVVGETELRNGDLHAFVWTPDGLTDLMTLGGRSSRAFGINARDWIVGESEDTDGAMAACLWRDGVPTNLAVGGTAYAVNDAGALAGVVYERAMFWPSPDASAMVLTATGTVGIAFDLNNRAEAVGQGEASDPDGRVSRAFSFETGVAAGLMELARGLSSSAQAVNENGQIAGFFEIARGRTHAFLFDKNGLRDVDTLNNAYSAAYGINDHGDVVGVMFNSPNDDDQAFLASAGGDMYNLNDLLDTRENWMLVEAWDINNAGQIAGYGIKDNAERAFLLTPLESSGGRLPRVRLLEPDSGKKFTEPADISMSADATGASAIQRVTFSVNGAIVGASENSPFRFTWHNAPAGEFDLIARAFDARGQMGVSPRVHVTVEVAASDADPAPSFAPEAGPTAERPAGADAP